MAGSVSLRGGQVQRPYLLMAMCWGRCRREDDGVLGVWSAGAVSGVRSIPRSKPARGRAAFETPSPFRGRRASIEAAARLAGYFWLPRTSRGPRPTRNQPVAPSLFCIPSTNAASDCEPPTHSGQVASAPLLASHPALPTGLLLLRNGRPSSSPSPSHDEVEAPARLDHHPLCRSAHNNSRPPGIPSRSLHSLTETAWTPHTSFAIVVIACV